MMDRILENDTALKIVSVLVAIAIWVQVNSGVPSQVERRLGPVPVTWLAATNHYTVMGIHPASVVVDIEGPPSDVSNSSHAEAWVDLAHITRPGTYSLPVNASVPTGTSLVSITPTDVTVTVDNIVTKKFPVSAVAVGHVPSGYGVLGMTPTNSTAEVTGPSTAVDSVKAVQARVDLKGQTAYFQAQVTLVPVTAAGKPVGHVDVTPTLMDVAVTVSPKATVPVVVRYHGTPAAGYTVTGIAVTPPKVTVFGPASVLAALTQVTTNAVPISGRSTTITKRVHLVLPSGATASPATVTVTITIGP